MKDMGPLRNLASSLHLGVCLQDKLPSAIPDGEPLPEGLLWLLLIGESIVPLAVTCMLHSMCVVLLIPTRI